MYSFQKGHLKLLVSWQATLKIGMICQIKNVCVSVWQEAFQKIQIPKYQVKKIVIKV